MISIRRRYFMTLLGGATAAWPLAVHAQQPALPVVGFLSASSSNPRSRPAFHKGLSDTGFVEGRNVVIELRSANNDHGRLPELANDLVRRRVAVIYASGGAVAARAAKAATSTVPIVFAMGDDPVADGLVASFNRPGGNVTGIAFLAAELGPKRLGLLKELVPAAARAVLVDPGNPATERIIAELRADTAFVDLVQRSSDALVVGNSSLFVDRSVQLATLAAHHRLPAIYYDRRIVAVGGLMSYGASIDEATRQAGVYVGRILRGEKPSDLPVMQTTKFELVINLQTARTLRLTVSPTLLALADEVIE